MNKCPFCDKPCMNKHCAYSQDSEKNEIDNGDVVTPVTKEEE